MKPVRPSDYRIWIFPVIQKILRKIPHNIILISKHKYTGCSWMELFILFGKTCCPNHSEIFIIIQPLKWMSRLKGFMAVTVTTNGFLIQISNFSLIQHFHIHGFLYLIPQHCLDLQSGTVIISLPISAESSSKQIIIDIYRLLLPFCTRHPDDYDTIIRTNHWKSFYIIIFQKIYTHFLTIIKSIPKILLKLCCIFQPCCMPITIFILFHPKNNNSAIAIGKGRISIP